MLKFGSRLALAAGFAAALAGVPAAAGDGEVVTYDDSMQCSALYTYLGAMAETAEDSDALLEAAARWLVLAMVRDGTEDGSVAEAGLEPMVDELMAELDAMGEDESAQEEFLLGGIDFCQAAQLVVAEEFSAAEA